MLYGSGNANALCKDELKSNANALSKRMELGRYANGPFNRQGPICRLEIVNSHPAFL